MVKLIPLLLWITGALTLGLPATHGTVLIELSGGFLKTGPSGDVTPYDSGLLMLVASTEDSTFDAITTASSLTPGSVLAIGSDDYVLYTSSLRGDGNNSGTNDGGEFQQAVTLRLNSAVSEGDALQLYWFPSLTSTSLSADEGTVYGAYRSKIANAFDATDPDGSSPWFLPAEGTSGRGLLFLTSDAGSQINTASSGTEFGGAEFTVVPEPGGAALLAAAFSQLYTRRRRGPAATS